MWLDKSVLSLPECATRLNCSEYLVRKLIHEKKLLGFQNCPHGKWYFTAEAIEQYLAVRLREQAKDA